MPHSSDQHTPLSCPVFFAILECYTDWDIMGVETGVSAWARSAEDDELQQQLHAMQRDARYAPPAVVQLHSGLGGPSGGGGGPGSPPHQTLALHGLGRTGRGGNCNDDTRSTYSTAHSTLNSTATTVTVNTTLGEEGRGGRRQQGGRRGSYNWADVDGDLVDREAKAEEEQEEGHSGRLDQPRSSSQQELPPPPAASPSTSSSTSTQAQHKTPGKGPLAAAVAGLGARSTRVSVSQQQQRQASASNLAPPIPGAAYVSYFGAFHDILSICYRHACSVCVSVVCVNLRIHL